MFQTFENASGPVHVAERTKALRAAMAKLKLDAYLVPRSDEFQGEYVPACAERLKWLTGFTGSAGLAAITRKSAILMIDGRYTVQARAETDTHVFEPLGAGVVGFDPWLHTADEIARLEAALSGSGVTLRACANLVDAIWIDQPPPPQGRAFAHPDDMAGQSSAEKRAALAAGLRKAGVRAAVITLPDSLCWLLNIRGADVPRNPVLHGYGILHDDARVSLFADPAKFDAPTRAHLGPEVALAPPDAFPAALDALTGPVRLDRSFAPVALRQRLEAAGIAMAWGDDPCRLPKACKTEAEIAATREAHLRDGAAMVEFLCWLDTEAPKARLTEIDVVRALEGFRRATNALHDISFDTICGAGPHGAVIHYRVTEGTNRRLGRDELLLVDSGGQYVDGTTDITPARAAASSRSIRLTPSHDSSRRPAALRARSSPSRPRATACRNVHSRKWAASACS